MSARRLSPALAALALVLTMPAAARAAALDASAVVFKTPDQFKWRDPTDKSPSNQTVLHGDPKKPGLYIYINKFKPGRFGNDHYHPNDRFITVIDGAGWRGTGNIVDPAHATRLPKGSFSIDHAKKVHWDGTKDEAGAYLIAGDGPATNIEVPKENGPWAGGDPSSLTMLKPQDIKWIDSPRNQVATLVGHPDGTGIYVQMLRWKKGNFSHPHFHPNDRFIYVLEGTWWVGTGNKFDPANLTVPMHAGTFVTHFAKGVHWDGAKDEDAVIVIIGEGPATNNPVPEAK